MTAHIEKQFWNDTFKLQLWHPRGRDYVDVLMNAGHWQSVEAMTEFPTGSGIELPMRDMDDIFEAFMKYKGLKTHDPTEVRVLREWLDVERNRVSSCLKDAMKKLTE